VTAVDPQPDVEPSGRVARLRTWLREPAHVDLRLALTAALFVSVTLFAAAVATWDLRWITAAAALLVPFAAWYVHLTQAEANRQAHERALELSKAKAGPATRPAIPTRPPLDEGGSVGQAPWAPGGGYSASA
jgi:hypothetical protein